MGSKKGVPKVEIGGTAIRIGSVTTGEVSIERVSRVGSGFELVALGGAEVLAAEESQFKEDGEFVRLHFVELVKQYPEQWIAVYRGKVVAADKELQALASKLRLEGFPLSRVVLEYMTEKKVVRVL